MITGKSDRWFTEEELAELSRPTMDRAIEALDRGDTDRARALCEEMKHEWLMLHDLMVEGVLGLVTFNRYGIDPDVATLFASGNELDLVRYVHTRYRFVGELLAWHKRRAPKS